MRFLSLALPSDIQGQIVMFAYKLLTILWFGLLEYRMKDFKKNFQLSLYFSSSYTFHFRRVHFDTKQLSCQVVSVAQWGVRPAVMNILLIFPRCTVLGNPFFASTISYLNRQTRPFTWIFLSNYRAKDRKKLLFYFLIFYSF